MKENVQSARHDTWVTDYGEHSLLGTTQSTSVLSKVLNGAYLLLNNGFGISKMDQVSHQSSVAA